MPGEGERPQWQKNAIAGIEQITRDAVDYPTLLIQDIPDDATDLVLTERIEELAEVSLSLNELGRRSVIDKLIQLKKGIPRAPARKTFFAALKALEAKKEAADREERKEKTKSTGRDLGKMKGHVFQKDGLIFRDTGEVERVSNFMLVPLKRVVKEGSEDWFRCRVEVPYANFDAGTPGAPTSQVFREAWNVSPGSFASSRSFKGILPMECSSNLTDEDLQGLKECFMRDYDYVNLPRIQSTEVLGRHYVPEERFVMPWGTLDSRGKLMSDPDIVYLSTADAPVVQRIAKSVSALDSPQIRSQCKFFMENCLKFHRRETMIAISGMFFSSLFASRLRKSCGGVPILNVSGSPGSGKTSIVSTFWQLVGGIERDDLLNVKPTPFAMTRELASTNSVMQCFDDWKDDITEEKMKSISELFRGVYSGETLTRGRQDQTVRNYYICAPCCISGESRVEHDEALMQRCIFTSLDRNWLNTHPESVSAFRGCQKLSLPSCAPFVISWSMRAAFDSILDKSRSCVADAITKLEHLKLVGRMQGNLTYMTFGILLFSELAQFVQADVGALDVPQVLYHAVAESFDIDTSQLLRPASMRTNLDQLLEDGATMAATGYAKEDTHFRWIDGHLCVCIKHLEVARQQWYRSRGAVLRSPGVSALRKMAHENQESGEGYVINFQKKVKFGSYSARCVELDVAKLPESIEISKFRTGSQISPDELVGRFGKMSPGGDA
jgi:hypothetical protein